MSKKINLLPEERRAAINSFRISQAFQSFLLAICFSLVGITAFGVSVAGFLSFLGDSIANEPVDNTLLARHLTTQQQSSLLEGRVKDSIVLSTEKVSWSSALEEIFTVLPFGIEVNSVAGFEEEIVIKGRAANRSVMISTAEQIKNLDFVTMVDSPPSNLIQATDANFVLTVTINSLKVP